VSRCPRGAGAPAETTCWTKPRAAAGMGIVRLGVEGWGRLLGRRGGESGHARRVRGVLADWLGLSLEVSCIGETWRQTGCVQVTKRSSCRAAVGSRSSFVRVRARDDDIAERSLVAVGTAGRIPSGKPAIEVLPGFAGVVGLWSGGGVEQLPRSGDEARTTAVGLEAEVADADEARRQHMQEEALDEGRCFEGEELLDAAASSIAIAKGHPTLVEGDQPFVADRDAVGVAAQIAEHLAGPRHGRLAVDHPRLGCGLANQSMPKGGAQARGVGL